MSLEEKLRAAGVWYRFIEKKETVHTADASQATGIDLQRITKNLVCRTNDGNFVLLIIPGDKRVNLQKSAEALGVKNVQLLGFNEAEMVSGYSPGATPSIFHKTNMTTLIDRSLVGYETIFCGGGTRNRLLELKTRDVMNLDNAKVSEITQI